METEAQVDGQCKCGLEGEWSCVEETGQKHRPIEFCLDLPPGCTTHHVALYKPTRHG